MNKTDRVIIVDGEAPESSDEEIETFSIPVSLAREVSESSIATSKSQGNDYASVYHKKLFQKNEDLWNHMSGLLARSIENSSRNLIASDQLLLKSQITLQSVSQSTKKVNAAMATATQKIRGLLTDNFLPIVTK